MKNREHLNVLIITSIPSSFPGGALKSAAEIAESFQSAGCSTFLMADNTISVLSAYSLNVIHSPYSSDLKIKGYYSRGNFILNCLKSYNINLVICIDKASCYHASFPCAYLKVSLLPIIPGGNQEAVKYPPLKLKKTLVFSSEMKRILIERFKFSDDMLVVKSNRFSFKSDIRTHLLKATYPFRIVYVSRLHQTKFEAFSFFIKEVTKLSYPIIVDVAGDGEDSLLFKNLINEFNLVDKINFIGYRIVDFNFLNEYNLVVSMGRGVIEASSMGIPVAVCGEHGYKGLLNIENLDSFHWSNFTGRNVDMFSSLEADVNDVSVGKIDMLRLSNQIRTNFDVMNLPDFILDLKCKVNLIPANGSLFRIFFLNLMMLLKR